VEGRQAIAKSSERRARHASVAMNVSLYLSVCADKMQLLNIDNGDTYSSRFQDSTETPPQLMPPTKLPIVLLSRHGTIVSPSSDAISLVADLSPVS